MRAIVTWFAKNGVAANLLMIVILGSGLVAVTGIRQQIFPEIETDLITVRVPYPGASPEEVEEGVILRIEEAVQGLEGIKEIRSTATENLGLVTVEVLRAYEVQTVLDDVKSRVDAIETFPEEAEQPVVSEVVRENEVLNVALSGNASERALKELGDRVRDDIAKLPEVTSVDLESVRPYEISIEVSEEMLREYGLTFDFVANAVRRGSVDLPGGSVETEGGEVLLRTVGQAKTGEMFERIPLVTRPDGTRLLLGDLAVVEDGFEDTKQRARFDGEPAVLVRVFRVGDQSATEVAEAVKDYVERARTTMPEGIEMTIWRDQSVYLADRLSLLVKNGLSGLFLVLLVLALFLRLQLAFWVSLGIPISFLGAVALMPVMDLSINMLTLFAFILVLGIVVDDAIVIGENIFSRVEKGDQDVEAAVNGATQVMKPVTFAVLTTMAAFAPLLFVPGFIGKIWKAIPLIVFATLAFSLIEAFLILPRHLSHLKKEDAERSVGGWWGKVQRPVLRGFDKFQNEIYEPLLRGALDWRYAVAAGGIALVLVIAAVVRSGWIELVFLPNIEADYVVANLTMPLGTPIATTEAAVRRIDAAAEEVARRIHEEARQRAEEEDEEPPPDVFQHRQVSLGEHPFKASSGGPGAGASVAGTGSHLGEISIELAAPEEREVSSEEIARRWREEVGEIPGAVELSFTSSVISAGAPINVQFAGPDLEELQNVADELKARLREIDGVYEIADSYRQGKRELELDIRPEAQQLGLSLLDLARQIRHGFYGEEAQRILRDREEVKVMVRYVDSERRSLADVENTKIRTPVGDEIPFSTVADVDFGYGYATITRVDRERTINVTADVDAQTANANEIIADLEENFLPNLLESHPDVTYSLEGEQREQAESIRALTKGLAYAALVIYVLMALPFRSYSQPFIVLFEIPFGMVGAVLGHVIMGVDLSVLSLIGMVALAGVVVNDSLVMIDYINQRIAGGDSVSKAVAGGGMARFRPIWLTSITTFAGLTPLLLESSVQAQFLIPMAISLGFGVLFSTIVTLVLLPCWYLILDDTRKLAYRAVGKEEEDRLPASA